ncbi:MAG: alpha/beta fold hydrolase [Deltaproteobacteria bacterium]|nr:alpha/beta fold hydrolase [Deltaproteobacteria bacterium]
MPVEPFHYAYFHGFASSPDSRKGNRLAREFARLGVPLERPDLNAPSFARLTATAMLGAADAMHAAGDPGARWRVVGSSMGGWLAALWASLHPGRVDRLVLLCPAFDMPGRWPAIVGPGGWERWREAGETPLPDHRGVPVPVHFALNDDLARWPSVPETGCDTLVIHGSRDETVPVESSRAYAAARPRVRLIEVDDGHLLADSLDLVVRESLAFFGLPLA